jgi:hypothetical protein
MEKLNPRMQERLERWKKNTLPVKSADKLRKGQPAFIARKDYGDDVETFKKLENTRR